MCSVESEIGLRNNNLITAVVAEMQRTLGLINMWIIFRFQLVSLYTYYLPITSSA